MAELYLFYGRDPHPFSARFPNTVLEADWLRGGLGIAFVLVLSLMGHLSSVGPGQQTNTAEYWPQVTLLFPNF